MKAWISKLGGKLGLGLLGVVALTLIVLASFPSLSSKIRDGFQRNDNREVLAKASADFTGKGLLLTVVKVRWKDSIMLEIFPYTNLKEETSMFDRIVISNAEDAYFMFQNNSTNLAITDIDNDGILEILAPTYDSQQNARLNTFKLRTDQKGFDRATPDDR